MTRARNESGRTRRIASGGVVVLAAFLAGCAGPGSPETFFALNDGAVVQSTTTPSRSPSLPGIVISAVTVPELVDRPQIVTRDASNRVVVSEQNLWAEPIRSGIARTLATRLSRSLDEAGQPAQVAAYPQTSIATPALHVTIDVVRFDAVPNGEAVVDAVWSIRRPSDGTVRTGRTVASSPISGSGYDAIVHSWNEALRIVDRDIAAMVVQIGVGPAPTR